MKWPKAKVNNSVDDISCQANPLQRFRTFRRIIEVLHPKIVPLILSNSLLSLRFRKTPGLAFNLKATNASSHPNFAVVVPSAQDGDSRRANIPF